MTTFLWVTWWTLAITYVIGLIILIVVSVKDALD